MKSKFSFAIAFAVAIGTSIGMAYGAKIFSGDKVILMGTTDSHGASGSIQLYLDKYHGSASPIRRQTPDKKVVGTVFGRLWPLVIDRYGNPKKELPMGRGENWLANLGESIELKREQFKCADCPVIFHAYMHGIKRETLDGKDIRQAGYLIYDPTSKAQINRAVEIAKHVADLIKAAGVDWVVLSTAVASIHYGRLIDYHPLVAKEFNKRYLSEGMYFADAATPSMKDWNKNVSPDFNHQNKGAHGSHIYSRELFRGMLAIDGLDEPAWIDSMFNDSEKKWIENHWSMRYTGPKNGHFAIGDKLDITWNSDCKKAGGHAIRIEAFTTRRDGVIGGPGAKKSIDITPTNERCPTDKQHEGKPGSWCCGESLKGHPWGKFTYTIDEKFVEAFAGKKGSAYYIDQPIPIAIHVWHTEWYPKNRGMSGWDWENPKENMIILHPWKEKRMDADIYPKGYMTDRLPPESYWTGKPSSFSKLPQYHMNPVVSGLVGATETMEIFKGRDAGGRARTGIGGR